MLLAQIRHWIKIKRSKKTTLDWRDPDAGLFGDVRRNWNYLEDFYFRGKGACLRNTEGRNSKMAATRLSHVRHVRLNARAKRHFRGLKAVGERRGRGGFFPSEFNFGWFRRGLWSSDCSTVNGRSDCWVCCDGIKIWCLTVKWGKCPKLANVYLRDFDSTTNILHVLFKMFYAHFFKLL